MADDDVQPGPSAQHADDTDLLAGLTGVAGLVAGARGVWDGLVGSIRNVKVLSALERMSVGVGAVFTDH